MKPKPVTHKRTRSKLRKILDGALADLCLLSATTRDYSRALARRQVAALQEMLEAQNQQLERWSEEISSRVNALRSDSTEEGSLNRFLRAARISPIMGSSGLAVRSMVGELLAVHEDLANRLRADVHECAERLADLPTAGFLNKLVEYHESTADALRSLLVSSQTTPVPVRE